VPARAGQDHPDARGCRDEFAEFFNRPDTFALGVCNGCQMMSALKSLIPGAEHWPAFRRNKVEQFEARFVLTEVLDSPSLFFNGMEGSRIPIVVSHGEGGVFDNAADREKCLSACATSTTRASRPRSIRTTRTVRRVALPP
jgi:phosphoribosylformylglycinamidine synthase